METVTVSQAPAVSEAPAVATPAAGGAILAALPSALQGLARFFLSLSGSSSLGAVLRAWLRQLQRSGFSCALRLLQVVQSHLVLRLRFLLVRVVLLLLPLVCPAVRSTLDPAGVVVARPAMGPTGDRRSVRGVGLLPLVLLLAVGRGTIGHLLVLQNLTKPRLLLPELDVRLEVLLAIFALLRQVTALLVLDLRVGRRGRPRERSVIAQVLVVDPPRLRVWRMTTGRVLSTR